MANWVAMGFLCVVLIAAAICDVRTGRVPNLLTYPAILIALLGWAAWGWLGSAETSTGEAVRQALIGLSAGLVPFAMIFAAGGLGGGDVKTMTAVGAISASWQCVLSTAFYAFLLGGVFALVVMFRRGLVRQTFSNLFGAALLASARVRPELDKQTPRIPFAVAICAGGIMAGAEILLDINTPWRGFAPSP